MLCSILGTLSKTCIFVGLIRSIYHASFPFSFFPPSSCTFFPFPFSVLSPPSACSSYPDRLPDVICTKPFKQGVIEFGCGQCLPCRINRRRLWTARLLLESSIHDHSSFLTLTYDDDSCPSELIPDHYQKWLKRLRKVSPKISYYLVGEYGGRTFRPHFHAAVFGLRTKSGVLPGDEMKWPYGHVYSNEVNEHTLGYCAKHITKITVRPELDGLRPEFARMSRRPAIGLRAIKPYAEFITSKHGSQILARDLDVPTSFSYESRSWPFGRYLRQQLRLSAGMEKSIPDLAWQSMTLATVNEYLESGAATVVKRRKASRLASMRKASFLHSLNPNLHNGDL